MSRPRFTLSSFRLRQAPLHSPTAHGPSPPFTLHPALLVVAGQRREGAMAGNRKRGALQHAARRQTVQAWAVLRWDLLMVVVRDRNEKAKEQKGVSASVCTRLRWGIDALLFTSHPFSILFLGNSSRVRDAETTHPIYSTADYTKHSYSPKFKSEPSILQKSPMMPFDDNTASHKPDSYPYPQSPHKCSDEPPFRPPNSLIQRIR